MKGEGLSGSTTAPVQRNSSQSSRESGEIRSPPPTSAPPPSPPPLSRPPASRPPASEPKPQRLRQSSGERDRNVGRSHHSWSTSQRRHHDDHRHPRRQYSHEHGSSGSRRHHSREHYQNAARSRSRSPAHRRQFKQTSPWSPSYDASRGRRSHDSPTSRRNRSPQSPTWKPPSPPSNRPSSRSPSGRRADPLAVLGEQAVRRGRESSRTQREYVRSPDRVEGISRTTSATSASVSQQSVRSRARYKSPSSPTRSPQNRSGQQSHIDWQVCTRVRKFRIRLIPHFSVT